jgi:hypothetical protein
VKARLAKLAVAASLAAIAAVAAAAPASATNECRGLRVCLAVAGPWVVVPAGGSSGQRTEYELSCPPRFIVGGLDAELSNPRVDVHFAGRLGSPINPGVTTNRKALFRGLYAAPRGSSESFRPRIGCVPASGGGGGIPTARPIYPARELTVHRVHTVDLRPGTQRVTQRCASGEQLAAATHAVGFYTRTPPTAALMGSVTAASRLGPNSITVTARSHVPAGIRAVVQVAALCAAGR